MMLPIESVNLTIPFFPITHLITLSFHGPSTSHGTNSVISGSVLYISLLFFHLSFLLFPLNLSRCRRACIPTEFQVKMQFFLGIPLQCFQELEEFLISLLRSIEPNMSGLLSLIALSVQQCFNQQSCSLLLFGVENFNI